MSLLILRIFKNRFGRLSLLLAGASTLCPKLELWVAWCFWEGLIGLRYLLLEPTLSIWGYENRLAPCICLTMNSLDLALIPVSAVLTTLFISFSLETSLLSFSVVKHPYNSSSLMFGEGIYFLLRKSFSVLSLSISPYSLGMKDWPLSSILSGSLRDSFLIQVFSQPKKPQFLHTRSSSFFSKSEI